MSGWPKVQDLECVRKIGQCLCHNGISDYVKSGCLTGSRAQVLCD